MRPRWYEAQQARVENGRVRVDPGLWRGDDEVRATATVVSVRRDGPTGPVVFGATEQPPGATPRQGHGLKGFFDAEPFHLDLEPGLMRIQIWRGSPTTDGNAPGSPEIYEWGFEASDYTARPAECYVTVPQKVGATPVVLPDARPKAPTATATRDAMAAAAAAWQAGQRRPTPLARIAIAAELVGPGISNARWKELAPRIRELLDEP